MVTRTVDFDDTVPSDGGTLGHAGTLERTQTPRARRNRGTRVTYDHDGMVERDRASRWGFLIFSFVALLLLPTVVGVATGGVIKFTGSMFLFGCFGLAAGVYTVFKLFPRFWVVVPQTSAYVTKDQFAKKGENPNVPYISGGDAAFPWELRGVSGNITLDILTIPFKETVPTQDTAMIVEGTVQFKFHAAHITTVVGIDASTVEQGFIAQINEWLSDRLSRMTGLDAKNSIKALREEIERDFEEDPQDPRKENRREMLLEEYGIVVTGFQFASIDFPPSVQETRDAVAEAARTGEGVWRVLGFKTAEAFEEARKNKAISEVEIARARDDFLAMSKNIVKTVQRLDITGGEGLAGAFLAGAVGNQKGSKQ